MARLTPEGQARETPESRPSPYLPWPVIERAVSGERVLQDKAAFVRRKRQVDQLRQAAQHEKLTRVILFAWLLLVIGYLIVPLPKKHAIPYAAFLGSFVVCLMVIVLVAMRIRKVKWLSLTTVTARLTLAGLLALAALAPMVLRYLHSIPKIARHPAASGVVDGLGAIVFALWVALVLWAVLEVFELIRILRMRRRFPDLLLFHHLAALAKKLSETDLPGRTFSDQRKLCDRIEQSARAVDAMANVLASPWHPDDEALRQSFASVASSLRALKREIALPTDTYEKLAEQACKLCMVSATGLYGLLPKASASASSVGSNRRARIVPPIKRAAAAFLPFALYLLLLVFPSLLNFTPFERNDLPTVGFTSLLWLLLYTVRFLDPNYSDVLTDLKNIPST